MESACHVPGLEVQQPLYLSPLPDFALQGSRSHAADPAAELRAAASEAVASLAAAVGHFQAEVRSCVKQGSDIMTLIVKPQPQIRRPRLLSTSLAVRNPPKPP